MNSLKKLKLHENLVHIISEGKPFNLIQTTKDDIIYFTGVRVVLVIDCSAQTAKSTADDTFSCLTGGTTPLV